MTLQEALCGWALVNGVLAVALLLLVAIAAGLTPKRPQFFPLPEQPWVWTEVEYDGSEVEYSADELLDMLAEDGDALLEAERNIGKVYLPPKERRAA